ncbi:helix-turn-helix transcriptional regulator [Abyssisolibacter fermentans]|uniref:helix-turn-helix transcriptional regulator n=1 Tax=Abyssisolibacter fermentans TaxID=1766203 RepID=UPI0030846881
MCILLYRYTECIVKGDDTIKRNNLKKLRKERGLTQKQIAEHFEITTVFYGMIERGERNPTLDLAKQISVFFKTTIENIFFKQ